MPKTMLDAEETVPFLSQNSRGKMPDGMEAEGLDLGPPAQAFHHMRGGTVGPAYVRLHRTGEYMVA